MSTRIIIPVFNEAGNVLPLVGEIAALGLDLEVYFVDDSFTADTMDMIDVAQAEFPQMPVRGYLRFGSERVGGIVGAVRFGMQMAKLDGIESIIVMDGDGQHDPSDIPKMLDRLRWNDLVPSTRYAGNGSREGLDGPLRILGSLAATWVAKGMFPALLADVTDPMTGFFALNLSTVNTDAIEANGFKVLLEILLTNPGLAISEVPVHFRDRISGDSKATASVAAEYLSQLVRRRLATPGGFTRERKLQLNNV